MPERRNFPLKRLVLQGYFSKIRDGTYKTPIIEKQPENVRYMYTKKKVYSLLEGDFSMKKFLPEDILLL